MFSFPKSSDPDSRHRKQPELRNISWSVCRNRTGRGRSRRCPRRKYEYQPLFSKISNITIGDFALIECFKPVGM